MENGSLGKIASPEIVVVLTFPISAAREISNIVLQKLFWAWFSYILALIGLRFAIILSNFRKYIKRVKKRRFANYEYANRLNVVSLNQNTVVINVHI